MTLSQEVITIAMVVFATMLTRFLPFFIFPANKKTPGIIIKIGRVLPAAILGMLVIYCLRDICSFDVALPTFLSGFVVIILHLLKKNMLLSIFGGTAVYILLINFVFL